MLLILSERINKIPQFPYKKHHHGQSGRLTLASVKISLPLPFPTKKNYWLLPEMSSYQKNL